MDPITAAIVGTVTALAQRGLNLIAGAVVAKGKAVVEEKLGVKIDDLLATPEGTEKLKALEVEHQKLLNELAIAQMGVQVDLEKARLLDLASARAMQIAALSQDDKFSKRFVYWLAICWSVFAMSFMIALTFVELPHGNEQYAHTILGFMLGTVVASIFSYFFGTNRTSAIKDTTISTLAAKGP